MLRVKEILEIPCMEESIVIAGERGLNNPVLCIDVLEVPDADQWVTPGTFLLTTAYAYKEDVSRLERLVRLQAEGGASGMGIKLGRFIQEVPQEVLKTAEKMGFPIILLPPKLPYVPVIKKVMFLIFERERLLKGALNKQDVLRHMIEDNISLEENIDLLKQLNLSPLDLCCFMLLEIPNNGGVHNVVIWELVEKIKVKWQDFFLVQFENMLGLLFVVQDETRFSAVKELAQNVALSFQSEPELRCVSISGLHTLEKGIKKAYREAFFTLKVVKKLMNQESGFVDFDSLRHLSFWYTHPDRKELVLTSRLILDPILTYDKNNNGSLLQTLKVFLLMDRNQKRTAEALHLHRNSLRYRLNQIEEIFGSDIFSGFKLQKLFFALITYTLLDDEVLI